MDAPRSAVRFSAVFVEIRALGSHFVANFRFEKCKIPITKTFFAKTPKDLLIGCWGYYYYSRGSALFRRPPSFRWTARYPRILLRGFFQVWGRLLVESAWALGVYSMAFGDVRCVWTCGFNRRHPSGRRAFPCITDHTFSLTRFIP